MRKLVYTQSEQLESKNSNMVLIPRSEEKHTLNANYQKHGPWRVGDPQHYCIDDGNAQSIVTTVQSMI